MSKIKVLHVCYKMNPGGVERWLLGVAEALQGSDTQIDILVHDDEPGEFDPIFKKYGVNIIPCTGHTNPLVYVPKLYRILKKHGPYDVVHSQVHHFSGLVLFVAWLAGVPMRISHSHSNRDSIEPTQGMRYRYLRFMKHLINRFGTHYVAVSKEALHSLYADVIPAEQVQILYCGIKHLENVTLIPDLRKDLGISESATVVGHVGRMSEPKNHTYLLKIFNALRQKTEAKLVLVGDGETREQIEREIKQLDMANDVILLGTRSDAIDVMASIFDVVAFPSLYEGLPLTVVEAQAVGVPILVADNITKEAEYNSELVEYASLNDSPEEWADRLLALKAKRISQTKCEKFMETDFYVPNHIRKLESLYKEN